MYYIRKELLNDLKTYNKSIHCISEIMECVRYGGGSSRNIVPIIPYLMHKVSLWKDKSFLGLEYVLNTVFKNNKEAILMAKSVLNENVWRRLTNLLHKYNSDDFAIAAIYNLHKNDSNSTPDSIIKLAQKILDIKPGDKVADLCCGDGAFLINSALEENNAFYQGYDINGSSISTLLMKLDLIDADIKIDNCDIFTLPENNKTIKYNKIFSDYPFGLNIRNLGAGVKYLEKLTKIDSDISKVTSSDWLFNSIMCEILDHDGKALGIMTNGSTWNSIDTAMRKFFVERKLVECVIALPERMFSNTNIATTMIVFSHNNDCVKMVDATKIYMPGRRQNVFTNENIDLIVNAINNESKYSKKISIENLRKKEYVLNINRYTAEDDYYDNALPFEDVIKSISRGAPCNAKQLDQMVSKDETDMQYLMLSNINDGIIDDNLPYLSYIDPKYKKHCLKNNDLIISKNGFPYKIAVSSVGEGKTILANGNLYVIELDEKKVNPYYIKAFLESDKGEAILKSITVGSKIPNIGIDKLKKIRIPIPTLKEQKKVEKKYCDALNEVKELNIKLKDAINKLHEIV